MTSRSLLHVRDLPYFRSWLVAKGWLDKSPLPDFVVLRMTHDKYSGELLVYKRLATSNKGALEHLTLFGRSEKEWFKWHDEVKK